jgi:hypothetical protein
VTIILGRIAIAGRLGSLVLSGLIWAGIIMVPNHLDPFAPLRLNNEVNWLTRPKLSRLKRDAPQCVAVLESSPVVHKPVSSRDTGDGCGFSNAVEVLHSSVTFSPSFTATCPLAVARTLLEAHVVLPAARERLGQKVVRVMHLGTYACRNIDHHVEGRRSEHAAANAIDVSGFVLSDGQRITFKDDWMGSDLRKRYFLRAVRDGHAASSMLCSGPNAMPRIGNHLHMDMEAYRAYRWAFERRVLARRGRVG